MSAEFLSHGINIYPLSQSVTHSDKSVAAEYNSVRKIDDPVFTLDVFE